MGSRRWAGLLGLAVVLVLGLLTLPLPLHGDQALAVVAARSVLDGGGLYGSSGFWDIRPPGLFLLHTAAVALPGDDAVGSRAFELVWLLATAALAVRALGTRVRTTLAVAATPFLVCGVPLALASSERMGQPESFVGGPLLLAVWGALPDEDGEDHPWRRAAAGAGAAVALLLKHPYAAIAVAAWILTALRQPRLPRSIVAWFLPVLAGALAVLVPVGAWIAATGDLGDALWTMAVYAPRSVGLDPRDPHQLVEMGKAAASLLAAGAIVAVVGLRSRRIDPLVAGLLAWIVVGSTLLLVQHWWSYLPVLLTVPVGMLAALGVDQLVVRPPRAWVVAVVAVVLFVLPLRGVARNGLELADHGFGLTAADRAALVRDDRPAVGEAEAWIDTFDGPGPVFAFGDPIALVLADRPMGASVHGWSPEFLDEELWNRLADQLEAERPVAILVDDFSAAEAEERGQAVLDVLERDYCEVGSAGESTFYLLADGSGCQGA